MSKYKCLEHKHIILIMQLVISNFELLIIKKAILKATLNRLPKLNQVDISIKIVENIELWKDALIKTEVGVRMTIGCFGT